jgi:hypothetical protein
MLPDLTRLKKDDDEIAGAGPSTGLLLLGADTHFTPTHFTPAQFVTGGLATWYEYLYPEMSCEGEKPTSIVATSDLWGTKRDNITESMKLWDHVSGEDELMTFFKTAAASRAGTLAHVVLTKKKASKYALTSCVDKWGIDMCDHGHLSVVFEHVYVSGPTRPVVSIGFFPTSGNAANLVPGVKDDGVVHVPDPMVSDWKRWLANVKEDDQTANIQDFVTVLNTFVYSPGKMGEWLEILKEYSYDPEEFDVGQDTFSMPGLQYSFYSGINPLPSFAHLTGSVRRLFQSIKDIEKKLPIVSKTNDDVGPLNCATYILAAFPEANLTCPLGLPIACSKKPEERFQSLDDGVEAMLVESEEVVKEADSRIVQWFLDSGKEANNRVVKWALDSFYSAAFQGV